MYCPYEQTTTNILASFIKEEMVAHKQKHQKIPQISGFALKKIEDIEKEQAKEWKEVNRQQNEQVWTVNREKI